MVGERRCATHCVTSAAPPAAYEHRAPPASGGNPSHCALGCAASAVWCPVVQDGGAVECSCAIEISIRSSILMLLCTGNSIGTNILMLLGIGKSIGVSILMSCPIAFAVLSNI